MGADSTGRSEFKDYPLNPRASIEPRGDGDSVNRRAELKPKVFFRHSLNLIETYVFLSHSPHLIQLRVAVLGPVFELQTVAPPPETPGDLFSSLVSSREPFCPYALLALPSRLQSCVLVKRRDLDQLLLFCRWIIRRSASTNSIS